MFAEKQSIDTSESEAYDYHRLVIRLEAKARASKKYPRSVAKQVAGRVHAFANKWFEMTKTY